MKISEYIVEDVVCDYGVYVVYDNGNKALVEICNSSINANLICEILNADLIHKIWKDEVIADLNSKIAEYDSEKEENLKADITKLQLKLMQYKNAIKEKNLQIEALNSEIKTLQGKPHKRFIIWNAKAKEWQFKEICELTQNAAWRELYKKIGNDYRKWRFEVRGAMYDPATNEVTII